MKFKFYLNYLSTLLNKYSINLIGLVGHFFICAIYRFNIPFLFNKESGDLIVLEFFFVGLSLAPINKLKIKYFLIFLLLILQTLPVIDFLKIKSIALPLTIFDLNYFKNNPLDIFASIGYSETTSIFLGITLIIIIISILVFLYIDKSLFKNFIIYFVLIFLHQKGLKWTYNYYTKNLETNWDMKYSKIPFFDLNSFMGTYGYIYYTTIEKFQNSNIFKDYKLNQVVNIPLIKAPQLKNTENSNLLPNIVFFLAESTFIPNDIFDSKVSIKDNKLFSTQNIKDVNQKIFVTAMGGGTWMSEFEILSGLDSKAFGVFGQYTHSYLSPKLSQSFPKYLSKLGYHNSAFYPVEGSFYGARFGYKNYGFNNFYDSNDLNIKKGEWASFSDEQLVAASIKHWPIDQVFFNCIVGLSNHSPHANCNDYPKKYNFFDKSEEKNCPMDVYLNRAKITEKAVYLIKNKLDEIYQKTKRPYLIVVFGDHQAFTFVNPTFEINRKKNSSKYQTFVKYISNDSSLIPKIKENYHLTLIPSLVSTKLSNDPQKWYFPEQLEVYLQKGNVFHSHNYGTHLPILSNFRKYINLN